MMNISLTRFEGPLSLLLYLIRKEEMNIMDINIHEITTQYLEYIKIMKEFDLEVAGEFIAMAASLIQIKSKMLLPQYDENGEVVEVDDPRRELVQKLLEYQKYQEASKLLYERPLVGRDIWLRGVRDQLKDTSQEVEIEIEENGLYALISAYQKILKSAKKRVHKVAQKIQSIASRILEIKDRLIVGHRLAMQELVDSLDNRARQTLITFLSLLELGKLGFVSLYQSETYSDIWIEAKRPVESDVISRVEEYESVQNVPSLLAVDQTSIETPQVDEEFLLVEKEDAGPVDEVIATEEMATDEEILAAENELFNGKNLDEEENV